MESIERDHTMVRYTLHTFSQHITHIFTRLWRRRQTRGLVVHTYTYTQQWLLRKMRVLSDGGGGKSGCAVNII